MHDKTNTIAHSGFIWKALHAAHARANDTFLFIKVMFAATDETIALRWSLFSQILRRCVGVARDDEHKAALGYDRLAFFMCQHRRGLHAKLYDDPWPLWTFYYYWFDLNRCAFVCIPYWYYDNIARRNKFSMRLYRLKHLMNRNGLDKASCFCTKYLSYPNLAAFCFVRTVDGFWQIIASICRT